MSEEISKLEKKIRLLEKENQKLKIQNALLPTIHTSGILPGAIEDILRRADENFSITSDGKVLAKDTGYGPEKWVTHLRGTASHLFADTVEIEGEGEAGEGRPAPTRLPPGHLPSQWTKANPWRKEHWNKTNQGQVFQQYGEAIATRLAELAGVTVDAVKPAA